MASLASFGIDHAIAKLVAEQHAACALVGLEEVIVAHDGAAFLRHLYLLQDILLGHDDAVDEGDLLRGMQLELRLAGRFEEVFLLNRRQLLLREVCYLMLQNFLCEVEIIGSHRLLRCNGIFRLLHLLASALSRRGKADEQSGEYDEKFLHVCVI